MACDPVGSVQAVGAIADVVHGASAAMVGTAAAAAGGGVLVVVGTTVAALAAPAFVRYRISRAVRETA